MKISTALLSIARILAMFDSDSSSSGTLDVLLHDSIARILAMFDSDSSSSGTLDVLLHDSIALALALNIFLLWK